MPIADLQPLAPPELTIGIDLGGTKIEGIVLDAGGQTRARIRIPTPRDDYDATLAALAGLVGQLEHSTDAAEPLPVGLAMPGSIAPGSSRVQNANSTWLNDRAFAHDLTEVLQRPLRVANDANCFALSEFQDGAGSGARTLFGVILGTGCGGGIVHRGHLLDGPRGIGGEWGHNPLPWPAADELAGPRCWCGRDGCLETWISGPGLAADHLRVTGTRASAEEIVASARLDAPAATGRGCTDARSTLQRHADRLARGLAHAVNLIDPDVIVLGGGLSGLPHLYQEVPRLIAPYIFAEDRSIDLRPPVHGDASGARGAARLWRMARPA